MTNTEESAKALKIELRALHDDSGLTTRKLKLLPNSSLLIARSSRSNSKQLIAAADNLVLDSPIVSREHARLTTDSDCTTLFIEDLGSMHGTRVNYVQLGKHVAYQLKCGDKLQIGNEVIRGEGAFPCGEAFQHFRPVSRMLMLHSVVRELLSAEIRHFLRAHGDIAILPTNL